MRKGWNCLNLATRFPHHHQRLCKFKAITPNMDVYQKLWTVTKTDNSDNNLKHVLINKENIGSRNLLKTSLLRLFLGRGYFVPRNFFFFTQLLNELSVSVWARKMTYTRPRFETGCLQGSTKMYCLSSIGCFRRYFNWNKALERWACFTQWQQLIGRIRLLG